ncbi:hypothetical protein [Hyphomicrobium sulfonivorans]|uniref:hypothetical protein n=1 Tax=Hyphomicrobium sulfonivorans TaxID=121290 RepID=UPI0012EE2710|nr:hypothetical protein [Hyphomicrobium sulfonivorans]
MTNAGPGALRVACEFFSHPAVIAAVGAEVEFGLNVKSTRWNPADIAAGHRGAHQASKHNPHHDRRSIHPHAQLTLQRTGKAFTCRQPLQMTSPQARAVTLSSYPVNPKHQEDNCIAMRCCALREPKNRTVVAAEEFNVRTTIKIAANVGGFARHQ